MASNHCIMIVTDRNGHRIHQQEILVPYNESDDCCKQAYNLRHKWHYKLQEKYPSKDYYVFAEWQEMKQKVTIPLGII